VARKQVGQIDEGVLDRADARAAELGQTRRVFVERALEAALRSDTRDAAPDPGSGESTTHTASAPPPTHGSPSPSPSLARFG
jgi:hypothetical protein